MWQLWYLDLIPIPLRKWRQHLLPSLIEKGTKRLLCDFSMTKYISSAGLRVLILTAKGLQKSGGQLVLCSLSSIVREVFEIAGLTQLFTIYDSVEPALTDLGW